jgi:hypothetical protein
MKGLAQRLEISFWTASIAFMQNRKAMRAIIFLFCFLLVFLLLSFTLLFVNKFVDSSRGTDVLSKEQESVRPTTAYAQKNTLIILVDELDKKQPKLSGLWLAVYRLSEPRLFLLPIHPSAQGNHLSNSNNKLSASFQLEASGIPTEKFFDQIEDKDIWWDHFLILDEVSLGYLIEITGGLNLGAGKLEGSDAVSQFALGQDNPNASLFTQAILFRGLCQETDLLLNSKIFSKEHNSLSGHWYSDLNFEKIHNSWSPDNDFEGVSCEFPILREASINREDFK